MKFGAYDPLYPNGIVTIAGEREIFGLRFLAADRESNKIIDGRELDFSTIRTGPNRLDQRYAVNWTVHNKKIWLKWCRTADKAIYGEVSFESGLEIIAEMYIPWEERLQREWVNFTRQKEGVFAGELISPFYEYQNNAVLFCTDQEPVSAVGYNQRQEQFDDFEETGFFRNISQGNIWKDMGLSWFLGAQYTEGFSFLLFNGSAGDFLKLPDKETQDRLIKEGKEILSAQLPEFSGKGICREIGDAFTSLLPYNTIYKAHTGRRYIMVDRPWARCEDGWGIQFNWDTFLSSWSAAWINPELAKENMLSGYDVQLPDGKIPLCSGPRKNHRAEPPVTAGRAQHIVQGLTLWQTYLHTKDRKWAKVCYEGAKRANEWWFKDRGDGKKYRDALDWGLLGFGYDSEDEMGILGASLQPYVAKAQYAYFETYDDSPQWTTGEYFKSIAGMKDLTEEEVVDEAKYKERYHMADMYTLERCCLYALDCECLSKIARVLGDASGKKSYYEKYKQMAERINSKLWSEEDGCYYNLRFDGTLSKKQSPDCFMPLLTGMVPENRKERLLSILKDETKFWGEFMIPSIAKDDPSFPDQKYWRGQIWPTQTLWTYLALKRAGEQKLAWELAVKAGSMLSREWKEKGFCPENYNAYTGRCSGSPHYNWGVLMGLPLLEELVEFREEKVIFGNRFAENGTALANINVDGSLYDMQIREGKTIVSCEGRIIGESSGTVCINRN